METGGIETTCSDFPPSSNRLNPQSPIALGQVALGAVQALHTNFYPRFWRIWEAGAHRTGAQSEFDSGPYLASASIGAG